MAQHTEEGTGKHPHKSAAEPHEHHEAPTTKGHSEGTHSKAESHSKTDTHSKSDSHASDSKHTSAEHKGKSDTSESADLKSREYKDKDGNIHHHTHTVGNKA